MEISAMTQNHKVSAARFAVRKTMSVLAFGLALPVLALSSCAKHDENNFVVGSIHDNHTKRHPIIIDEREKTLDIPVARDASDITPASASAVDGVAHRFRRSAGGAITILLPDRSPNEAAARKVGSAAAARLRENGIPDHRIRFFSYDASGHGNAAPVRLSYQAVTAKVEKCGKWPKDLTEVSENKQYNNFGCAQQSNLAAIIANPSDLIAPRGMSDIDAERRNTVIDQYRQQGQEIERRERDVFELN
ncbi:MAG: CpaD family pilus assembly protein [Rhizobiaceae bacterium]